MKTLHLICVGKNKEKPYLELEADYLKRLKTFKLQIHEVKSHEEKLELEAEEVLKKLQSLKKEVPFFLLTEKGKAHNSIKFSQFVEKNLELGDFALVIGGASGHGDVLYQKAKGEVSLSLLTFPHKMARLILVEQIYRAETISLGHPYNK